jgi:hypothetical protein
VTKVYLRSCSIANIGEIFSGCHLAETSFLHRHSRFELELKKGTSSILAGNIKNGYITIRRIQGKGRPTTEIGFIKFSGVCGSLDMGGC